MKTFFVVLFGLPVLAIAATGTAPKPTMVFTAKPSGGHVVTQPLGPNLSRTPQPVTATGTFTANKGGFFGGQKFKISPTDSQMAEHAGEYEYKPRPTKAETVPVKVVSKIPTKALAKTLLKALPVIGTAMQLHEIGNQLAQLVNQGAPDDQKSHVYSPESGVYYLRQQLQWGFAYEFPYSSSGEACYQMTKDRTNYVSHRLGSMQGTSPDFYVKCYVTYKDPNNVNVEMLGGYVTSKMSEVKVPADPAYIDAISQLSPQVTNQIIDTLNNPSYPQMDIDDHQSSELPSIEVLSQLPPDIQTTTKSNGDIVTSVTNTTVSVVNNNIDVSSNTTTTTTDSQGNPKPNSPDTNTPTDPQTPTDPEVPPEEQPPDLCEKNPDILACKKLDQPEQTEIPKETRTISLVDGPTFSGGSCIPDVVTTVNGQSMKILETSTPCGWITDYMKPLILLLASISAVFIVMPREV